MNKKTSLFLLIAFLAGFFSVQAQNASNNTLRVKKTADFDITGYGDHEYWSRAEWIPLKQRNNQSANAGMETRFKILYSDSGIYLLYDSKDEILNASIESDFEELWHEDVVEAFFWPDQGERLYFEYELSPLNYELILLISNREDNFASWRPFNYQGDRRTRHMTSVKEGEKQSGADISSWTAEFFIPFKLLHPLNNAKPEPGTRWRANLYRIDYDSGQTLLAWQPIEKSFHEYQKFGTLLFE
jgi:hypothetical protein